MGLRRTVSYLRNRRRQIDKEVEKQFTRFEYDLSLVTKHLKKPLDTCSALDLGCGQMLPTLIGLKGVGCQVVGIDLDPYMPGSLFSAFRRRLSEEGPSRAVSECLRNVLIDSEIHRRLARKFPGNVTLAAADTVVMSADDMKFQDNSFDIIMSNSVFEHISDMPAVMREVHRVLKPGGIALLNAHLYPSYFGGHNREMLDESGNPIESLVPPWDHLREHKYPAPIYLNKLKLDDFRKFLDESPLDLVEWHTSEPELRIIDLLTPELEKELTGRGYTRNDLITDVLWIIAGKSAAE